jgi:hypothetical protein
MPRTDEMTARLAAFGRDVLIAFFNDGEIGDCDGLFLEEKAHEHGLTEMLDDEGGWRPTREALKPRRKVKR